MTEVKPLSDETPQVVTVGGIIRWYEDQLAALKSENEKLRGALEFYADRSSWTVIGPKPIDVFKAPIVLDGGERARAALSKAGA